MTKNRKIIMEFSIRNEHGRSVFMAEAEVRTDSAEWIDAMVERFRATRFTSSTVHHGLDLSAAMQLLVAKRAQFEEVAGCDVGELIGLKIDENSLTFGHRWCLYVKKARIIAGGREEELSLRERLVVSNDEPELTPWRQYGSVVAHYVTKRLERTDPSRIGVCCVQAYIQSIEEDEVIIRIRKAASTMAHYINPSRHPAQECPNPEGRIALQLAASADFKWEPLYLPMSLVFRSNKIVWESLGTVHIPLAAVPAGVLESLEELAIA